MSELERQILEAIAQRRRPLTEREKALLRNFPDPNEKNAIRFLLPKLDDLITHIADHRRLEHGDSRPATEIESEIYTAMAEVFLKIAIERREGVTP